MNYRRASLATLLAASCLLTALSSGRRANSAPVPKEKTCADCTTCFVWTMYREKTGDEAFYYKYIEYQCNVPVPVENSYRWSATQYWMEPNKCVGGTPDTNPIDPPDYYAKSGLWVF